MKRVFVISVLALGVSLIFAGCCAAPPPPAPPPPPPVELEPEPEPEPEVSLAPTIWTTVDQVESDCSEHLTQAKKIRGEIVAVEGERTLENTLSPLNSIYIHLDSVLSRSSLFANVSPVKEVRDAAEKCQQEAMMFVSEIQLDRGVYDAIAAVSTDGFDAHTARFVEHVLRDYKRTGVDKDDATRAELDKMKQEMVKLGQEFRRRIREGKLFIEVKKEDLKGLPEDYIAQHPPGENGKIKITTDYPDFLPVANHADKEKVRKDIYFKHMTRAHPENAETLKKLLETRHKYATTLGYSDWADYNAEDKMVKDKKVISDFIDDVSEIARPRMKKDLKEILARKKKDKKKAARVEVWDRFYYVNKIRAEKYGVDAQVVRTYFNYPDVRDGVLGIAQEFFGVKFELAEDAPVWHESVQAYNVLEGEKPIGRFYLDMHPRDGKFGHAAQFQLRKGVKDVQLPTAALVCNFPSATDTAPGLMGHDQVTVFFHEFGHLMHSILAGRHVWASQSGIECEWDFVETPSQLFEEWAWDYEMLKLFAVHYETGEIIPEDLVKKMRLADEFGKGVHVMRQMFYAALSYNYHDEDPADIDLLKTLKKIQKGYNPYPYVKNTHTYSNFGHIVGYSSGYYTYMWSLVLSKDIYEKFKEAGMMDEATALAYRQTILETGGTMDADVMMKNFLGREYSFEAFKKWLEEE